MVTIAISTVKRLFAVSGNRCAFPKCPIPLVDSESGTLTANICHIRARSPEGPRYDPAQTDEQRNDFANLLLMCPVHHTVIDADDESYTVARLEQLKAEHEGKFQHGLPPNDELARALISVSNNAVTAGSILLASNQSGGQMAHSITNIHAAPSRQAILEPILARIPDTGNNDELNTLRVWLHNVGDARPTDLRLTVKFPEGVIRHAFQGPDKRRVNGCVEYEHDTAWFVANDLFSQLHPGDTSRQIVMEVHYFINYFRATESPDHIEMEIRNGDSPARVYKIALAQMAELEPGVPHVVRKSDAGKAFLAPVSL